VNCVVLEVEPPHRVVYSWTGGGVVTRLVWTLTTVPDGTHLQLDHTGFQGFRGLFVSMIPGKGWGSKILFQNLPAFLDRWKGSDPVPAVPEADCHR
jgi:uncharacterized protein YndB with AHSA1/START domain